MTALIIGLSVAIFQAMSQYRSYPEDLFAVPAYMEAQLRQAFEYGGIH